MEFEFLSVLERSLADLSFEANGEVRNGLEFFSPHVLASLSETIIEVPDYVDAAFASTVSFELYKRIREKKLQTVFDGPALIANTLQGVFDTTDSDSRFNVALGEQGHINVKPAEEFEYEFLAALLRDKSLMFSTKGSVLNGDSPQLESESSIGFDELEKKAKRSANDEAIDFFRELDFSDKNSGQHLWMLFGLLSEKEVSLESYRLGMLSSENTPRYLGRFLHDVRRCKTICSKKLSGESHQIDSENLFQIEHLDRLLVSISRFRFSLSQLLVRRAPEQLCKSLVGLAKDFYLFFNRPQSRSLEGLDESQCYSLKLLANLLENILVICLGSLEISCENKKIVLNLSQSERVGQ